PISSAIQDAAVRIAASSASSRTKSVSEEGLTVGCLVEVGAVIVAARIHLDRPQPPPHPPALDAPADLIEGEETARVALASQQEPADEHAAEVARVAHVRRAEIDLQEEEDGNQPDRAERDGRVEEHDGAIGPRERGGGK